MYFFLLLLVAYFVYRLQLARTGLVIGVTLWSLVLLFMGFTVGGFATFFFSPEVIRHWVISPSWVTQLVDSPTFSMTTYPLLPIVFIGDCIRWMFELAIFQSGPAMWICMFIALCGVAQAWVTAITTFNSVREDLHETQERRDRRLTESVSSGPYDKNGNFIGYKSTAHQLA